MSETARCSQNPISAKMNEKLFKSRGWSDTTYGKGNLSEASESKIHMIGFTKYPIFICSIPKGERVPCPSPTSFRSDQVQEISNSSYKS